MIARVPRKKTILHMSTIYWEFDKFLREIRQIESRKRVKLYKKTIENYWNEVFPHSEFPTDSPLDDIRIVLGYKIIYSSFIKHGVLIPKKLKTNYKASKFLIDNPEKFMKKLDPKSKSAFTPRPSIPMMDPFRATELFIPVRSALDKKQVEEPGKTKRKEKKKHTIEKKSSPGRVARIKRRK